MSAQDTDATVGAVFKAHLKVQPVRGTRLILVTYESHNPKQAAQIANAIDRQATRVSTSISLRW